MCNAMDELMEDSRLEGETKGKAEGKAEGMAEGEAKRSTEIAKNMLLEKTISCETIAKCSGLSLADVQKLAEQLEYTA